MQNLARQNQGHEDQEQKPGWFADPVVGEFALKAFEMLQAHATESWTRDFLVAVVNEAVDVVDDVCCGQWSDAPAEEAVDRIFEEAMVSLQLQAAAMEDVDDAVKTGEG